MNEDIVKITKKNRDIFEGLDPFGRLKMLDMPDSFALAALREDEAGEKVPAAILTGFADSERLSISWIGVASSMRFRGIGEGLLLEAFKIADLEDIPRIEALVSSEYKLEMFSGGAEEFFSERLFDQKKPLPAVFTGVIGDLGVLDYMKQDTVKLPKPVCMADLDPGQIKTHLSQLDGIAEASKLYPVLKKGSGTEADLSFMFIDKGEAYGAILLRLLGESLMPVYFFSESDNEAAALIINAFNAAKIKYGQNKEVQTFFRSDRLCNLIGKIFPTVRISGSVMVADLDRYRALKG